MLPEPIYDGNDATTAASHLRHGDAVIYRGVHVASEGREWHLNWGEGGYEGWHIKGTQPGGMSALDIIEYIETDDTLA